MFSSGLNCNLSFPSCLGYTQDSEELIPKMTREPIILNVYDMVNNYFYYDIMNKINSLQIVIKSNLWLLIIRENENILFLLLFNAIWFDKYYM